MAGLLFPPPPPKRLAREDPVFLGLNILAAQQKVR
jgi:hypothetical protein